MESENISADRYSLLQLKAWCTAVGLNASGAKATLAARLSALSAEARGLCPGENVAENSKRQGSAAADNFEKSGEDSSANDGENNDGVNNDINNGANNGVNNGANNGMDNGANNGTNNGMDNGANNGTNNGADNGRIIRSDHDNDGVFVRSDVACVRSGTFGRRPARHSEDSDSVSSVTAIHLPVIRNNDNAEAAALKVELLQKEIEVLKLQKALLENKQMAGTHEVSDKVAFETIKEIIPMYDGGDGFTTWYNQVMHYRGIFKVDDAMMCVAIHHT
ncbi:hyphally regulated cell wall protein 3-like [Rhagoletis pomonella]|uniref:hyphally regulated cell wall protein 3-like n=1 Tax=Rhagoletis pomonella TaxID=28610 RepID=UPI0017817A3E|nr:hyphally regulated cell wall protein 3-like [Rhagoletis pomonella]